MAQELHPKFKTLFEFIDRVPGARPLSAGDDDGTWWVKMDIDIKHDLAWNVVQEFGFVLNYLSLNERLPTTFKPVSPPPYMNGGPDDFLSWIIECPESEMPPGTVTKWLEARLPDPVDDLDQWNAEN